MPVYFIQAGESGPVKVGFSKNPIRRRDGLQGAHTQKLIIRALYEGGREEEMALHQRFKSHRLTREWFAPIVLRENIDLPALCVQQAERSQRASDNSSGWSAETRERVAAMRRARFAEPAYAAMRKEGFRRAGAATTIRCAASRITWLLESMRRGDRACHWRRREVAVAADKMEAAHRTFPGLPLPIGAREALVSLRAELARWNSSP